MRLVPGVGGRGFAAPVPSKTKTATVGMNMFFGQISNTIRFNYSTQEAGAIYRLDNFGGAIAPSPSLRLGTPPAAGSLAFLSLTGSNFVDGPIDKNFT